MTHPASAPVAASSTDKSLWVAFAIMVAIFAIAPIWVYPVFLMKVMCFALFACAFNLLLGFGGLLSFGHAMFLGTAGYAAAHAAKVWGWNPELAVLFGTLCSAALSFVVCSLAIRRQGIYFAMITLALAQMIYFFSLQAPFTGGEDGIQAVPRGQLFGLFDLSDNHRMYMFVMAIFWPDSCLSGASCIHPSDRSSKPFASTRTGPPRWATTPTVSSSWPL